MAPTIYRRLKTPICDMCEFGRPRICSAAKLFFESTRVRHFWIYVISNPDKVGISLLDLGV
jgi:hypothetical protein